mgnify:CR=1 FL=1|jgi:hypothetical protein
MPQERRNNEKVPEFGHADWGSVEAVFMRGFIYNTRLEDAVSMAILIGTSWQPKLVHSNHCFVSPMKGCSGAFPKYRKEWE